MRIHSIDAIAIDIPLTKNFGGSTYSVLKRSTVITRLRTDDGTESEVYNGDNRAHSGEIARMIREELAPLIVGMDVFASERIWATLFPLSIAFTKSSLKCLTSKSFIIPLNNLRACAAAVRGTSTACFMNISASPRARTKRSCACSRRANSCWAPPRRSFRWRSIAGIAASVYSTPCSNDGLG